MSISLERRKQIRDRKRVLHRIERLGGVILMQMIANGLEDGDIAFIVGKSVSTVQQRVKLLRIRTGSKNRAALVAWGFRNGVLT